MTKYGWRTPVSADGKGFPDMVMVKPPRLIFAELKSETGKLTKEQEDWIKLLILVAEDNIKFSHEAGIPIPICRTIEIYIWRPSQFDEIVRILR